MHKRFIYACLAFAFFVSQANASGISLTGAGGPSGDVDISFVGSNQQTPDQLVYTFTNEPIGAAASDRIVIVCVNGAGGAGSTINVSTITIGGTLGTELIELTQNDAVGSMVISCWGRLVATGTTATIVVTFTGAANSGRCMIGVWRMIGQTTLTLSDSDVASVAQNMDLDINVPYRGSVIAAAQGFNSVTLPTITFSGVTEDFEIAGADTTTLSWAGAHENFVSSQAPLHIDVDLSVAPTSIFSGAVAISFGPN